jgi:hypothetical protein
MSKSKEVVDWKQAMVDGAKRGAQTPVSDNHGMVSTRGGVFTVDDEITRDMTVVVLGYVAKRKWYEHRAFDSDDKRPPICFAQAVEEENLVPHSNCGSNVQAPSCAECPHSEWGSKPGNSKAQWCKVSRELMVVPIDANTTAESRIKAQHQSLSIPPTRVKSWDSYASYLGKQGLPPWAASTKISIAPSKYQFSISFDLVTPLNGDAAIMAQLHALSLPCEHSMLENAYTYEDEEASADRPKDNF